MGLNYINLDQRTRNLMLAEIERDVSGNSLFLSDNLSPSGKADYPTLLRSAASGGSDSSLAANIQSRLNSHERPRRLQSGEYSKPPIMRRNAHEMLAEGEFNRFYMRAVCLRAIEDGITDVMVYRARQSQNPREGSEAKVGQAIPAVALLSDLRSNIGIETILGIPGGPNSGISVRLP